MIENDPIFKLLEVVQGHKEYHLEGSGMAHTKIVLKVMKSMTSDKTMHMTALLHDIGKIANILDNQGKSPGDWSYPGHSEIGAQILGKFLPETEENFKQVQWYIRNHIKAIYWKEKKIQESLIPGVTKEKLALLGFCDLRGSICIPDLIPEQLELQKKLLKIYLSGIPQEEILENLQRWSSENSSLYLGPEIFKEASKEIPEDLKKGRHEAILRIVYYRYLPAPLFMIRVILEDSSIRESYDKDLLQEIYRRHCYSL